MDKVKIGQFIADCRKDKKITQEQLAEKLNISKNAVSKWERGICLMDMPLLKPLSEILGVSVNDILSGEKIPEYKIKEKSEENIIKLSEFNHYKSVTIGTIFVLVTITVIIIYSLIKDMECFGYTTLLFGFTAVVYFYKYKQSNNRNLLLCAWCMIIAFVVNFVAFIVSTI
ncbi:MAG: DUF6442 family protein [Bacilli bacterium]|nr:DUF6442 family protein [Bacilli bacterium]